MERFKDFLLEPFGKYGNSKQDLYCNVTAICIIIFISIFAFCTPALTIGTTLFVVSGKVHFIKTAIIVFTTVEIFPIAIYAVNALLYYVVWPALKAGFEFADWIKERKKER